MTGHSGGAEFVFEPIREHFELIDCHWRIVRRHVAAHGSGLNHVSHAQRKS
jgi:hypothetical protein